MKSLLALLLLAGCPSPAETETETDTDTDAAAVGDAGWEGRFGGRDLPESSPTAVWARVPTSALAVAPSGYVAQTSIGGVDLGWSVMVWISDVQAPCDALAAFQADRAEATEHLTVGATDDALAALDASQTHVPASWTSITVGLAAEDEAGFRGTWPLASAASEEGADGWHASALIAEHQLGTPDWSRIMSGQASGDAWFALAEADEGRAEVTVGAAGAIRLQLATSLDDGGALTLDVEAARCEALELALADAFAGR